jgi:hypothetical protein
MAIGYGQACPKPEPRKRVKARKDRAETTVKQRVRAACVARDGDCRLQDAVILGLCSGESEWAHMGQKRRARTRGMDPEVRHTTAESLMLCTFHHQAYDAGKFDLLGTAAGANAALVIHTADGDFQETFIPMEFR